ncbi:UbiD family decarboxylase [Streptomyces sp. NBC_00464]|uniref:UbiD family decarboxylase n=1 Tax=Streptomyces sp. NBC_00464 TaxID=2975751 RepID=UPI002E19130A
MTQHGAALNFRDFVDELLRRGDAVQIDRTVDPDLEIGAVTRRVYETRSPAPLFASVSAGDKGMRVFGAPAGLSSDEHGAYGRLAAHVGLPSHSSAREILEKLVAAMHADPVPPQVVPTGPCKENILLGEDVDLERLPVPLLHREDGGRYVGTYGFHVVQSPDGRWTSWSVARTMLHDRTTLVGPAMPQQHVGMIREMWRELDRPTPWAMVLGAPPAALAAAGMPLPMGVDEDGYVGALSGSGVEVVRTETNGLYVPANAEIVLEGYISADETGPEGPMGEYHGYSFPDGKPQPLFHVEAMTFRDRAILPVCVAGVPPEENHTVWGTMISAEATDLLRSRGLPVDLAWCSYEAATCWMVVSVDRERLAARETTEEELVRDVAEVLFGSHAGWLVPKVILVGSDIDVTDIGQVVWALATRYRPGTEYVFPDTPGIPMVPYLSAEQIRAGHGGKSVMSCIRPEEFSGEVRGGTASFLTSYPQDLQRSVIANWTRYGYESA